jgi:hypothetical protein
MDQETNMFVRKLLAENEALTQQTIIMETLCHLMWEIAKIELRPFDGYLPEVGMNGLQIRDNCIIPLEKQLEHARALHSGNGQIAQLRMEG